MSWLGGARTRASVGLLAAFMATGCAASDYVKAAQQVRPKNPHAAVEYLGQALKADPKNEEALALLKDVAGSIAEDHATRVADLERSGKFADAVAQCDRVLATRKLVTELPGGVDIFVNADIRTKLAKKASEKALTEGKAFHANGNDKKAAQSACIAKGFDPGNAEAQKCYDDWKKAATIQVAVAKFASASHHGQSISNDVTRRFFDKIVEKNPQFIALVHEGEGNPQAKLVGNIGVDFKDAGWKDIPGHRAEKKLREKRDSSGAALVDDKGNTIYEEYRAEVHWVLHERSTSLGMTLGYQVKMNDGTVKWAKEVSDRASDAKKWVSDVRGDKSVLPSEVADLPPEKVEVHDFAGLAGLIVDGMIEKLSHELFVQQKK
jgi:hypothetical protein